MYTYLARFLIRYISVEITLLNWSIWYIHEKHNFGTTESCYQLRLRSKGKVNWFIFAGIHALFVIGEPVINDAICNVFSCNVFRDNMFEKLMSSANNITLFPFDIYINKKRMSPSTDTSFFNVCNTNLEFYYNKKALSLKRIN